MVIFPVQSVQQDRTRPSKSHMANKLWDSCLQHQRHLRFKTSYIFFLFFLFQMSNRTVWFLSLIQLFIQVHHNRKTTTTDNLQIQSCYSTDSVMLLFHPRISNPSNPAQPFSFFPSFWSWSTCSLLILASCTFGCVPGCCGVAGGRRGFAADSVSPFTVYETQRGFDKRETRPKLSVFSIPPLFFILFYAQPRCFHSRFLSNYPARCRWRCWALINRMTNAFIAPKNLLLTARDLVSLGRWGWAQKVCLLQLPASQTFPGF